MLQWKSQKSFVFPDKTVVDILHNTFQKTIYISNEHAQKSSNDDQGDSLEYSLF